MWTACTRNVVVHRLILKKIFSLKEIELNAVEMPQMSYVAKLKIVLFFGDLLNMIRIHVNNCSGLTISDLL